MIKKTIFPSALLLMSMFAQDQSAWSQQPSETDAATADATAANPGAANAAELIRSASRAAGRVVEVARNDASLSANSAQAKPFWDGMQTVAANLESARTGLASRNDRFFTAMSDSISGFAQAQIALIMNEGSDPRVAAAMDSLGGILETLYQNYSKEAARLKQGGELTAAEVAQLDKLIAQQDELLRKLDEVERNVAANNEAMKRGIEQIREESRRIRRSQRTVAGFTSGFFAAHFMHNWLWGWHWWWGPWGGWCPGYIDISIIIWDDWIDAVPYEWDLVDTYVDIGDLDLDAVAFDDALVAESFDYVETGDFSLDDGDLEQLTYELDLGWDDVTTDVGAEIMDAYEFNFDNQQIYEHELPIETFEDFGMDDFGGGFDDFGDFDFGGFDF